MQSQSICGVCERERTGVSGVIVFRPDALSDVTVLISSGISGMERRHCRREIWDYSSLRSRNWVLVAEDLEVFDL